MDDQQILTFDIGTTAVKVSLFSDTLTHLCSFAEEYSLETRAGGITEVDPTRYKIAIKAGLAKARATHPGSIKAISVTTQGETLIPVDKNGVPLMNAIVWLDTRAGEQAECLANSIDAEEFYRTTGLPELNGALPLAKLVYIKEKLPEIYENTYKFLLVEDFILHWLTGCFVTEKALQCSTGYFDIIADCYWDKALILVGIGRNKLPEALSCGEAVGKILPQTAQELALPLDVTIVTGAMDQVAAALGAGCTHEGMIAETTGTALVMAAYTQNPNFEQISKVTIYRHAIDGSYLYLPIGNTAGMMLKWFKDQFCTEDGGEGQDSYRLMDELAAAIPAGCEGLITLPYLAGMVNPDNLPQAKAVFFGATLSTTKAHFIRSIMEAVCFMLRDFIDMLKLLGVKTDCIHSLGGGSRSSLWQQMKADICQKEYASMRCSEMASMGAAILAAKGIGLTTESTLSTKGNLPMGKLPIAQDKERYLPDTNLITVYQEGYERFKALYQAVKKLY